MKRYVVETIYVPGDSTSHDLSVVKTMAALGWKLIAVTTSKYGLDYHLQREYEK